ncbi:MAG TPA: hypothetical protein DCP69_05315 [Candidatus Omnitrophica bacterium]|nr:hypothetical protein [Candidatus Omnitrophota bacterium]
MTERPILFSGPMVRALPDGRKTQTRRLVKHHTDPEFWDVRRPGVWEVYDANCANQTIEVACPHGVPGDRLWVRETFAETPFGVFYRAEDSTEYPTDGKWRPSIFMPRRLSRLTLEITEVRVQRLQDITPEDAIAEGVFAEGRYSTAPGVPYPVATFAALWDGINSERASWASNPWVWCISFRRLEQP